MKYDKDLYNFIKDNKKARERFFKNRTVAYIMQQKYPSLKDIPLDKLEGFVKDINTLDREWRLILKDNKELRGLDYDTKKKYEQLHQIQLGYESGYFQSIKDTTQASR
jgi:hypothetical protein